MAKRVSLRKAECPVARALDAVGDRWSLLIVRDAFDGARRFGEFQQSLGVSRGILTARLRHLVALGVLDTAPASDGTAYLEYVLTPKGADLFPLMVALRQWGEGHCFAPGEKRSVLVETRSGRPVGRLAVRSEAGRVLAAADTTVQKVARASAG
jgi:DNA-binding HxlR family transcriptional regulator